MKLTSPDFKNNEHIPSEFTCQGEDVNPGLIIEDIPASAVSLALVVDDPDAPMGNWDHWIVFDMPLLGRVERDSVPGRQGVNDFGRLNYGGPCPPSGTHRYFFKLYALDAGLGLEEGIAKGALEKAMEPHILEVAELVGLYKKS
ncbi:MAG: YbhB/YbcL family Raf kinase inhibitor-like protein [Candidatus Omnitrophica bacterium]|nr:YbhB/YbcL family Raf kinase inhibitor-like protein [Candidatus Omnitrophota bacterium]